MTNQELYNEIKELREDVRKDIRILRKEFREESTEARSDRKIIHRDFYLFKGKSIGFMTALVGVIELIKHYVAGK